MSGIADGIAAVPLTRSRRPIGSSIFGRWLLGALGLVLVAIAWQLVAAALGSPVFPRFTTTLSSFGQLFHGSLLSSALVPSLVHELGGFAISAVLGVALGLLLGFYPAMRDWLSTVVDFLKSLPYPLVLPLAIVVIGLDSWTVIVLVVACSIWPVLINTADAARAVDPLVHDVIEVCGLSRVTALRKVLLPAVLPEIMAGLRVVLGVSLSIMVVAEMLGATNGLGHLIVTAESTLDSPQTYAGVLMLGLFGWCLDTLFLAIERRAIKWKVAS